MPPSLKKQAVHGAFWSFAERFGQQGIQFVVSIVLARLLAPKDFGVLGMLVVFIALAQSVIDSGFGQALIQKQDADRTDESTVFWFNLFSGAVMAGLLFTAAPWIAAFYDTPLLVPITRVFSLNLIINSFGIVQNALLTKELAFKKRMKASIASLVVSGLVGVFMAWCGFGVWSLVAQQLTANFVRTVGLWVVHPWRPALVFSRASFRVLWKFGSNMLASGLLYTFFVNIYYVVIGKLYSAAELGFYERGMKLMVMTAHSVSQVVSQVNFPLLARMQDDPERMRRVFGKVLQTTMLVVAPMMAGFGVTAHNLIYVLYGEKWMPCVPYLQIMCIYNAFYPFHLLNLNVLLAFGRSDLHFRLETIKRVLTILSIVIMYRYGVIGLLWGQVACSAIGLVLNTFYVHRFLEYGLLAQMASVRRILISSLVMAVAAWAVGHLAVGPAFVQLILQVAAGGLVFIAMEWLLKEPVFMEFVKAGMEKVKGGLGIRD